MPSLTPEIILAAIDGFEAQKQRIDAQIAELRGMLTEAPAKETGKRKVSPATLQRMREGQQRRWTAAKGESAPAEAKPKRKLSAVGRANIVAALKKRWAAKKAPVKKAAKRAPAKRGPTAGTSGTGPRAND